MNATDRVLQRCAVAAIHGRKNAKYPWTTPFDRVTTTFALTYGRKHHGATHDHCLVRAKDGNVLPTVAPHETAEQCSRKSTEPAVPASLNRPTFSGCFSFNLTGSTVNFQQITTQEKR